MGAARAKPAQPGTFYVAASKTPSADRNKVFPLNACGVLLAVKLKARAELFPLRSLARSLLFSLLLLCKIIALRQTAEQLAAPVCVR